MPKKKSAARKGKATKRGAKVKQAGGKAASGATLKKLAAAIKKGSTKQVEEMLSAGVPLDRIVDGKHLPLALAVDLKQTAVVRLLLDAGADVNATGEEGDGAIHETFDPELIEMLLKAGADPNQRGFLDVIPLHCAAANAKAKVVSLLAHYGADIEAVDEHGRTPLICAVESGSYDAVKALLDAGAAPDAAGEGKLTPLHRAAGRKGKAYARIVQALIAAGADVSDVGILLHACRDGSLDNVKALIAAGADVSQAEAYAGQTPLMMAVEENRPDCVEVLLEAGAGLDARLNDKWGPEYAGKKARDIAVRDGLSKIVKMLDEAVARRAR